MPSPFPGMDPYLEQFWGDVHQSMVTYARDQLQAVLPGDLRARVEERVVVELPYGKERNLYPDIRVVERGRRKRRGRTAMLAGVAVAEPLRLGPPDEPATQGYIEIRDLATGRRVVTVIEVLSPSNKVAGPGADLYQKKQQECSDGRVNLVEIDLLRTGAWALSVPEELVPPSHRTTYRICVRRAWAAWRWDVYRVPLREALPVIKIPLRPSDKDVPLDLQAVLAQCYRNGGYDDDIDYQADPVPALVPADARWAATLLREQGRRAQPIPKKPRAGGKRPRKQQL